MADLSLPARDSVDAQAEMFRLAQKECGLSLRAISAKSPIPYNTLRGWAHGTAMPAWALGELADAGVPDHLLSLVTAPWKRSVVTDEETDADFDDAAEAAAELETTVRRARHPNSPGGIQIVHSEKPEIKAAARKACAKLRRVA